MNNNEFTVWQCEGLSLSQFVEVLNKFQKLDKPTVVYWEPESKKCFQKKVEALVITSVHWSLETNTYCITIRIMNFLETLSCRRAYILKKVEPLTRFGHTTQLPHKHVLSKVPDHENMPVSNLEISRESTSQVDVQSIVNSMTTEMPLPQHYLDELRAIFSDDVKIHDQSTID